MENTGVMQEIGELLAQGNTSRQVIDMGYAPPMMRHTRLKKTSRAVWTGIRNKYTLATTPEQGSETDTLMIKNFLTTLADVAISVASRNLRDKQEGEE